MTPDAAVPPPSPPARPQRRRDLRLLAVIIVAAGIAVLGYMVTLLPAQQLPSATANSSESRRSAAFDGLVDEPGAAAAAIEGALPDAGAQRHFAEARRQLSEGNYDQAIEGLTRVRAEVQHLPESYLLVGLALLGKQDYETASDFFAAVIERDPTIAESYFGFAVAAEGLGDLDQALGGMRTFLHLQTESDPYRLRVAQARSAIWEWEAKLGRGEWGPTAGIPPGFTAEELQRDERGAGTKVPIPGIESAEGFSRYTIKYSDRIKMFEK